MEAIIIKPTNSEDAMLMKSIARKMKIKYSVISDDDKEDYAMARAILAAEGSKVVSEESIIKKLKR